MTARRFTAADLENLTEGITPGPWEVLAGHPGEVGSADNQHWIAGTYDQEGQYSEEGLARAQADTRLIAAAPELAADHHRVLTELEEWLLDEQELIESMDPTDPVDQILIVGAQSSIKSIRRILEGEA